MRVSLRASPGRILVGVTDDPQAEAMIDTAAIAHNIGVLQAHAAGARVMAVVKGDGYGHGAATAARAALAGGATELGVCTAAEAVQLRRDGIDTPVLCWLNAPDTDFGPAVAAGVEIGVPSAKHLESIAAAAERLGVPATVSVKVDTGLNRNGTSPQEYPTLLAALRRHVADERVRFRALFSHLAWADAPHHPTVDTQRDRFLDAIALAKEHGLEPEIVHLANSAATLTRPDLAFDMVRPGIAVYGLSPIPAMGQFGLRPAMTLQARIALVKRVAAGDGVSYGHEWTAPRDTTVALIPLGYADGVWRALGGRIDVWIAGSRYPQVGRICMDQFVVDLGQDSPVSAGDTAVLFGPGTRGEPTAQDWADLLGTIHYEVVTAPRGRVVRTASA
jgi:alanine racemase